VSGYGGCPGHKELAAYAARTCSAVAALWVQEHLRRCNTCYWAYASGKLSRPTPTTRRTVVKPSRERAIRRGPSLDGTRGIPAPVPGYRAQVAAAAAAPPTVAFEQLPAAPQIAHTLVANASNLLPPAHRDRYEEEWNADLARMRGTWWPVWWALTVRFYSARTLRRLYLQDHVEL
jgi:hypothetical protein